ncbi:bifunctional serine/threonine-protein kinase/ABC transporter substrate-binding protein [Streptomyces sp. 11x1]|uniref:bifunctional serine/threonine-protein kinase/ABC transporter substrate-binding protein n=1 Tax=Streptomyces sp. 11x1 TaxID=3038642 RepID=UPI002930A026|nr:bifunctional serine/threonine-protein kinase/ABC transporter substrate-binding protein [Streptomyces sp. 11x1]WNZ06631.1 bifunctional serine/threonine-protein kinase/ABC transporter substrate-binding protein [Streptomyces sp. 11x1]
MERLLPTDPSRLGGNRLLGRLGAGGMGVVYLARTGTGDLAAVKVIQPEYADQADFRARFRREASSAGQVDSPWVVRVVGADTEAAAPWLATAFVPGPSLEEAVAACGPLPDRAVRVLGKVLASALAAVHEARLVHRDVKPGNVLLALDGPRLIDFGIARPTAADETELTSDGMVVGTPGFLSPEQARARRVGAASDVFSLGCVLAYAATGRPPFGTGTVDGLLYRTVHDEPELDGVADADLRALLVRCLAKEPEQRPTAPEVDTELVEDAPVGTVDWLPDPVVRMIADRSARMLALPGIEPTEVSREPLGRSRRRVLALGGGAALLLAGGGAALWAALRDDEGTSGATTTGSPWAIGLHADLTGPLRKAGRAQERGARLAVERFNAREGRPFTLALRTEDDRGEPARALRAARRLTGSADVLAVLGPTGYSSTQAALEVYDGAGMPLVTVSELSTSAAESAIAGDAPRSYFQAATLSAYGALATVTALGADGVGKLGLLGDRAGRLAGMESMLVVGFQAQGRLDLHLRVVPALASAGDLAPVTIDMLGRGVDGFYYLGTPDRAAAVARALAERNFTGPRYLDAASATDAFLSGAGRAAEGWQVLTSYIGPDAAPVNAFATAYRKRYGGAPGPWAAEAYDVTRLLADRLTALAPKGGNRPTHERVTRALTTARFTGVAATYAFDDRKRMKRQVLHRYRVQNGQFAYVGAMDVTGT